MVSMYVAPAQAKVDLSDPGMNMFDWNNSGLAGIQIQQHPNNIALIPQSHS